MTDAAVTDVAITRALEADDVQALKPLLSSKQRVESALLLEAARFGAVLCVRELLQAKADANFLSPQGASAM